MTSLNPVLTVGKQIGETLRAAPAAWPRAPPSKRAVEMLDLWSALPSPARRVREYPHQLSGGMRQRVMIAMALACNPKLLIADEPTTALDVTIQAQILDLMRDLKQRVGAAIMLITHDLGVVAEMAQRVVVMYAGRKVEEAPVDGIVRAPLHPYTQGLLGAVPKLGSSLAERPRPGWRRSRAWCRACKRAHRRLRLRRAAAQRPRRMPPRRAGDRGKGARPYCRLSLRAQGEGRRMSTPLLAGHDLKKHYPLAHGLARSAVRAVRLRGRWRVVRHRARRDAVAGRRIRLRQIDRRQAPSCGWSSRPRARSSWMASASTTCRRGTLRPLRRRMQVVFQDPFSSLNPRMRVRDILAEPIRNFGLATRPPTSMPRIAELMDKVRLPRDAETPLSARVLRRPAATHRHRPGARRRARTDRLRRGGVGARRLGQGADRQSARRSAATSSAWRCCSSATTSRSSST